ncbi:MAG: M1 family aminopeptidase, partial [Gemmatimonadota bacterium]
MASYAKPAAVLHALQGVLGKEVFLQAYHEFFRRWAFKHAYPWDLWKTFEDVSGQNLSWFWRSWYYESTQYGGPWV